MKNTFYSNKDHRYVVLKGDTLQKSVIIKYLIFLNRDSDSLPKVTEITRIELLRLMIENLLETYELSSKMSILTMLCKTTKGLKLRFNTLNSELIDLIEVNCNDK